MFRSIDKMLYTLSEAPEGQMTRKVAGKLTLLIGKSCEHIECGIDQILKDNEKNNTLSGFSVSALIGAIDMARNDEDILDGEEVDVGALGEFMIKERDDYEKNKEPL